MTVLRSLFKMFLETIRPLFIIALPPVIHPVPNRQAVFARRVFKRTIRPLQMDYG